MKKIVLIDICGTIFDSNTTFDFLDYSVNSFGYFLLRKIMYNKLWRIFNKVSVVLFHIDMTRVIALQYIKGRNRQDLLKQADDFYNLFLVDKIKINVLSLIDEFRNKGYTLILVSGTLDFIAQIVAEKIDVKYYVSTELVYRSDICIGEMNIDRLGCKLPAVIKLGFNPPYYATITDNYSDIDILNKSEHKIIVLSKKNKTRWLNIIYKYKLNNSVFIYD